MGQDTSSLIVYPDFKIYDRLGIEQSPTTVFKSGGGGMPCNTNDLIFDLEYIDPDGLVTPAAQNIICQVLQDISEAFVATADPCLSVPPLMVSPTLRIQITTFQESVAVGGTNLGYGTSFYYNYSNVDETLPGIVHGSVWKVINGGADPLVFPGIVATGDVMNHGRLSFNFHPSINWNYNLASTSPIAIPANVDFYQVVLREVMHLLGIASWIDADGSSIVSENVTGTPGLYTRYDRYLMSNVLSTNFINVPDACYAATFAVNATELGTTCANVRFSGNLNPTLNVPIYAPVLWDAGRSLVHFDNTCTPLANYLLHPFLIEGAPPIRVPTTDELLILCELGYEMTGDFGNEEHNTAAECGSGFKTAGVDDEGSNCSDDYSVLQCEQLIIPFADLLPNDENAASFDATNTPCLEIVYGDGAIAFTSGDPSFVFTPGNLGMNIVRYMPYSNGRQANTTFIYINVIPCLPDCPIDYIDPQASCNIVCNPELFHPDCLISATMPLADQSIINLGLNFCPNMPGWFNINHTPDYWLDAVPYSLVSPVTWQITNPINPGFLGIRVEPALMGDYASESVATAIELDSGVSDYLFSIFVRFAPITIENDAGATISFTENLTQFLVYLTNAANLVVVNSDFGNEPTPNFPLLFGYQIPNAENTGGVNEWRQVIVCVTPDNLGYDRLFMHGYNPPVPNTRSYIVMDQIELVPDVFIENYETNLNFCGVPMLIGEPICESITNMYYEWENLNTGAILPDTEPQILVAPDETTTYRVTRRLDFSNNPIDLISIHTNCVERSAEITVSVPGACCPTPPPAGEVIDTEEEVECCLAYVPELINFDYVADGSVSTWTSTNNELINTFGVPSGTIRMNANLIIPSGVSITMQNMQFQFGPEGRIVIEPNAKLILDGDVTWLRGLCGSMWQGIRVLGPGLANSRDITAVGKNYGVLEIINNSKIDDALVGIATMNTEVIDLYNLALEMPADFNTHTNLTELLLNEDLRLNPLIEASSGGVFKILNGALSFTNCFQGINLSRFNNGNNTPPVDALAEQTLISQVNVSSNSDFLAYPFNTLGNVPTETGIEVFWYFDVDITGNTFTDVKYGIKGLRTRELNLSTNNFAHSQVGVSILNGAMDVWFQQDIKVADNSFEDCRTSMQFAATDVDMRNNIINQSTPFQNMGDIGIFLQGCDFRIEENNNINNQTFGTILVSNDIGGSRIDDNFYTGCQYGIVALGNNMGVSVTCNQFTDHWVAMYVHHLFDNNWNVLENGMFSNQGRCNIEGFMDIPADNVFTQLIDAEASGIAELLSFINVPFTYFFRDPTIDWQPTINNGLLIANTDCTNLNIVPIDENCSNPIVMEDGDIADLGEEYIDRAAMEKVRYYIQEQNNEIAAKDLLESIQTKAAKRELVKYYINTDDFAQASQTLSELPDSSLEDHNFKQLYTIQKTLKEQGRTIFEIDSLEEDSIRAIAADYTKTSFDARAILAAVFGESYILDIQLPELMFQGDSIYVAFKQENTTLSSNQFSQLYPNPANDYLFLNYQLADKEETARLVIYNTNGHIVKETKINGQGRLQINTTQFASGIYYYHIDLNGHIAQKEKLIIIH